MPDMPLSFLALIPSHDTDPATTRALMDHVRQLADGHGGKAHALLAGPSAAHEPALTDALATSLDHVWFIPTPSAATQTQQYVDLFASALQSDALAGLLPNALMLVSAQADNEAFAGALAARLDATPLGRCTELVFDAQGALHATRGAYGNRLLVTLESGGAAIAAIRPRARTSAATAATPRSGVTQVHVLDGLPSPRASVAITPVPRNETHASLDGARIVISGGRGMGNDDQAFPMLYDIAEKLGGAVGASLPAVDAGWAPVTRQVGISGKYVSPDTYLAIGISGTPQHLAGIDPHTRIVAVNKDPEANIFNVAQAGAIAEWQALLPALLRALEKAEDA
jgi:electron transfer flavoprotein alpha subunit